MARPFTLPEEDAELERLINRLGMAAVAKMYGVTAQAVSKAARERKLNVKFRNNYKQWIPWKVKRGKGHQETYEHRMLRAWAKRETGDDLTEKERRSLEIFEAKMHACGMVIHYERERPADLGGPWMRVPRREGIDTGWIRNPEVPD